MSYMPTTRKFLRMFALYPDKSITKVGFTDTLRIILISLPLWFVVLTSYAYLKVNLKTADIAVITDAMYTNFIFTMMCVNYILLTVRKFQVRKVIDDIGELVEKRKQFKFMTGTFWDLNCELCWYKFHFKSLDNNEIEKCWIEFVRAYIVGILLLSGRLNGCAYVYDNANKRSEYFIKNYTLWCFIGNMGVNCFPFVRPLFHFITGKYSFESWYTPYKS